MQRWLNSANVPGSIPGPTPYKHEQESLIAFRLHFCLGTKDTVAKIADFPSYDLFRAYIDAETKDLKCQDAYYALQATRSREQRQEAARTLDLTRGQFHDRWAKKNIPESDKPPVPPKDEDIVA